MSNVPFRVVRGEEIVILKKPFAEGCVYFATDTKRIYMDTYLNGEPQNKISMGGSGNSGIYYAHKGFTDSSDVSFSLEDLEGDDLPNVNDLIINYKSTNETRHGFYKVVASNVVSNTVETEYLPVGGGSGSGSSSGGTILIKPETPSEGTTTLEKGYKIKYSLEAYNKAGAPVNKTGKASFIINGTTVDAGNVQHGGTYEFDVSKYLDTSITYNRITLKIVLNTGALVDDIETYDWTVKCVDLQLEWDWVYKTSNFIKESAFNLNWKVKGGIDCITHIMVDDQTDDNHYFMVEVPGSDTEASISLASFPYGAHKITMWLEAMIGNDLIKSDSINHMLTFINGNETTPIITVPYFNETATQYDTLDIPFLVYKPNTESLKVSFYVDGIEVLTDDYLVTSNEPHHWPYTLGQSGEIKLTLAFTSYSDVKQTINLKVKPLDLGITEPAGATFNLKASSISGNAQLKQLQQEGKISFSPNFDWTNGGLKTETDANGNVSNYICVRQGTTMTLNYQLFKNQQVGTQGKTFKFCFKAMNCYNYDAKVLECYDSNSSLGLQFTAQQALFDSPANRNFTTQYCEGSYIELETEIWPDQPDNVSKHRPGDRFLMFWVDGVPTGVTVFDTGTSFVQGDPKYITIGSNECDVYVYVAKVYEKRLSSTEHLNSFILDAPNVNEILARFKRNDILGSNNEISYEKLIENNPGCHAYLYELPEGMTTSKEVKKPCHYTEYYQTINKPYIKARDAKVFVQGTSSAAYGVAAYNVRTDFKGTTMYDGNDQAIAGRKVSDTSIPVKYTCTKVNVASCENTNNALNAEWYNRFQPYYDGHRRKSTETQQYRDCMEFDFGVMFIKDHNDKTDYYNSNNEPDETKYPEINVFAKDLDGDTDIGYLKTPYYKLYSIANMGNDKKNIEVFHDINNPKACCVEVLDNQNAEHWMTVYNENAFKEVTKEDGSKAGPFYEFRYSVEDCEGENPDSITTKDQEDAFLRLVKWMAETNPNAATNEPLGFEKTYGTKVFTGFNPPGYNDSTSSGISLAKTSGDRFGVCKVDRYAGTYTTDSFNYRMAKMLDECEQYLVMDSVVFHYLFIERHTMVDNVAKNTFWSTEDGLHWDLTKNYDNDTSDGNNNSGYLAYQYGNEIGDTNKGTTTSVFNAINSVWLNFIKNLPEVQENLYGKLSAEKAWDAEAYLKLFQEKQSLIPERCWIEDYFRKYIRPRRLGLDGSNKFIQRLEGGKKTHQRNQFETYHGYYMDSKYCVGSAFKETGAVDMRLNTGDIAFGPDTVIPVSYYIDLYPSAKIGGQLWRKGQKIPKGTEVEVPIGSLITAAGDGTCYFYASNMIQTMTNISSIYPTYIAIAAAKKLRELEAGSSDPNYFNHNLTQAVLNDNTQLEKAQLQQVGHTSLTGLDLSKLSMLRELKIDMGSTFPTLTLAKGGIIDTLYLNEKLNTFKARELNQLGAYNEENGKGFKYDANIFSNLKHVLIQDCPIFNEFSYELAYRDIIQSYCFNGVTWNVPTEHINIDTGAIVVLENLLKKNNYVEVSNRTLALTGKLIINLSSSLDDNVLDEYKVYEKYKKEFPNLEIEYSGNLSALKEASTISFYNDVVYVLTEDTVANINKKYYAISEDGKTYTKIEIGSNVNPKEEGYYEPQYKELLYQVKTNGTKNMGFLISSGGPTGVNIGTPFKDPDTHFTYSWSNSWKNENTEEIKTHEDIKTETPNMDTIYVAQYNPIDRLYKITLRDHEGNDIEHNIGMQKYGTDITSLIPFYLYRPHNTSGRRYEFQGWINARDYISGKPDVTPITQFIVEGDTTYYAFYLDQDCVADHSRMDYFEFPGDGKTIYLKNKYRYLIQEPLTLPLMNGNIGITTVGDFGAYSHRVEGDKIKIPTIYFENNGVDGYYTTIQSYAFWSADQGKENESRSLLQSIYLPNTMKKIESYAFIGCTNLRKIELPDTSQNEHGLLEIGTYAFNSTGKIQIDGTGLSKLITLGTSAFYNGGDGVVLESIPNSLRSIPGWAFALCPNVSAGNFEHVNTVGANAFDSCGQNKTVNIVLPTNLRGYSKGCFKNYTTKDTLGKITYEGNGDIDEVTKFLWGEESAFDPTTIEQVFE